MATLKITNLKTIAARPDDNLWETGLNAVKDATALSAETLEGVLPKCNTEKFAGTVEVPVFGNSNQYIRIAAGKTETLAIGETEEEKQFYLAMAQEGELKVEITE